MKITNCIKQDPDFLLSDLHSQKSAALYTILSNWIGMYTYVMLEQKGFFCLFWVLVLFSCIAAIAQS